MCTDVCVCSLQLIWKNGLIRSGNKNDAEPRLKMCSIRGVRAFFLVRKAKRKKETNGNHDAVYWGPDKSLTKRTAVDFLLFLRTLEFLKRPQAKSWPV
jgi:hypothetical protein